MTWVQRCLNIKYLPSLASGLNTSRDWIVPAKTGQTPKILPNFPETARAAKKNWRIINTVASIWREICSDICPWMLSDSSLRLTVFLELRLRKTVRFSKQIMSADKFPRIFSRQVEAIVYILPLKWKLLMRAFLIFYSMRYKVTRVVFLRWVRFRWL